MQGLALPRSPAVGRVGITHHPLASPSHPRRAVVTRAEPNNNKSSTRVSEIHQELLKEIEERRKSQAVLLEKLNKLAAETPQGDAGPAAPAVEAYAPPPPPPPPPVAQAPVFVAPAPAPPPPRSYTGAPVFMPPAPTFDMPMTIPLRPEIYIEPAPPVPEPVGFLDSAATDADAPPDEDLPPPLAGPNVMNIVMVGAECAPWSKTGGLGDVMSALPKALARRGHRVMCVAPRYANYDDAWETGIRKLYSVFGATHEVGYFHSYRDGVDYIFVDHPSYHGRQADIYGGDRLDLVFRCALLCKAALEAVWHVPCGGITYGDQNLCFIANDWHTALLPVYLQAHYRDYGKMNYARCAFVIHNMAHQGRGPFIETDNMELSTQYKEQMRLYDPIGGEHMNIMKAGLECAHRLVAVSHGYAWECQTVDGGWGLHEVLKVNNWKLRGIVNGIDYDEWDPATDKLLQSDGYKNYTTENFAEGKRACKVALQKELGLPVDPDAPMLGFIGRLDYQKGVDLIRDNYDWLMSERVQLVMLGSGRADLEDALRDMENRNKAQCRCWVGFSAKMAHRITAGADILLMPSRFEPCGLNQLYAMKYGTVPIVHAVGGLRDTVQQFNPFENKGTGWTFDRAEPPKLREAVGNALYTYRQFRNSFNDIGKRGMEQDLSWDNAAAIYEEVLVAAKFQW